jgi:hypothetical protein
MLAGCHVSQLAGLPAFMSYGLLASMTASKHVCRQAGKPQCLLSQEEAGTVVARW